MKTVEIFSSFTTHMASDSRVQKYGLILVRSGVKGLAKVNPMMVWVDAGLAVCDAATAYFRYAAETEVTRQLQNETQLLKQEIQVALEKLRLDIAAVEANTKGRLEFLMQTIDEERLRTANLVKVIAGHMDTVKRLSLVVHACREDVSHDFEELQDLQRALDVFLRAALMCLSSSVDS